MNQPQEVERLREAIKREYRILFADAGDDASTVLPAQFDSMVEAALSVPTEDLKCETCGGTEDAMYDATGGALLPVHPNVHPFAIKATEVPEADLEGMVVSISDGIARLTKDDWLTVRAHLARLRAVEEDNARLRALVDSLTAERDEARRNFKLAADMHALSKARAEAAEAALAELQRVAKVYGGAWKGAGGIARTVYVISENALATPPSEGGES